MSQSAIWFDADWKIFGASTQYSEIPCKFKEIQFTVIAEGKAKTIQRLISALQALGKASQVGFWNIAILFKDNR